MAIKDQQLERNLKGIELEKSGDIEKAIILYEENILENFEGNHPYDRLAIIYKKQNNLDNEIRVLEKAILVFEQVCLQGRNDGLSKLNKFKDKLEKTLQRKK